MKLLWWDHLKAKGQDAIKLARGWHNLTGVTPLAGDHPQETSHTYTVCGNEAAAQKQHTVEVPPALQRARGADPGTPPWPRCPLLGAQLRISPGTQAADYNELFWASRAEHKTSKHSGSSAFGDKKKARWWGKDEGEIKHTQMYLNRSKQCYFGAKHGYAKIYIWRRSNTRAHAGRWREWTA